VHKFDLTRVNSHFRFLDKWITVLNNPCNLGQLQNGVIFLKLVPTDEVIAKVLIKLCL
jgi:hypothetical protein